MDDCLRVSTRGREQNHVVLRVQRRILGDVLRRDVVVGELEEIQRLPPPAFRLGILPRVEQRDARRAQRVELDVRRGRGRVGRDAEVAR